MKRLFYALIAASALGLAAGGLAVAQQSDNTVQQDEFTREQFPMPPSTVKQSDDQKEQSESGDTKSDSDSK